MASIVSVFSGVPMSQRSFYSRTNSIKVNKRCVQKVRRDQAVVRADGRKFFVGGNWKCNGTKKSVDQLVSDLNAGTIPQDVEVVCAPPFMYLHQVKTSLKPPYEVAAQNCWKSEGGAYTGEVCAEMLVDNNINWVILGHSERRIILGENNELVGEKCKYALEQGLRIIPCIGETLEQRNSGEMFKILDAQMQALKDNISDWSKVVVAYEPVWAIGTSVVATPEQAQEVHAYIRKWMTENVSADVGKSLRILYGGSVKPGNSVELAQQEDVDGFLVGGASLDGSDFVQICKASKAAAGVAA
eukprot:TRINITY_DN1340_c0_g1_i1.p1 TRINITY_DN1340_c0_g1~~TRINITY_DN1340_c0_g1_i1.p1  ORF type:complete len:324 (+),score=53.37 TRINITY_DN1340_c0_g1_i1:75-974(+)